MRYFFILIGLFLSIPGYGSGELAFTKTYSVQYTDSKGKTVTDKKQDPFIWVSVEDPEADFQAEVDTVNECAQQRESNVDQALKVCKKAAKAKVAVTATCESWAFPKADGEKLLIIAENVGYTLVQPGIGLYSKSRLDCDGPQWFDCETSSFGNCKQ